MKVYAKKWHDNKGQIVSCRPFTGEGYETLEVGAAYEGRFIPNRIKLFVWLTPGSGYACGRLAQAGVYECEFVSKRTAGFVPPRPAGFRWGEDGERVFYVKEETSGQVPNWGRFIFDSDSKPVYVSDVPEDAEFFPIG